MTAVTAWTILRKLSIGRRHRTHISIIILLKEMLLSSQGTEETMALQINITEAVQCLREYLYILSPHPSQEK